MFLPRPHILSGAYSSRTGPIFLGIFLRKGCGHLIKKLGASVSTVSGCSLSAQIYGRWDKVVQVPEMGVKPPL